VPFKLGGAQAFLVQSVPQVPDDQTFPDSKFQIPWLGYLSAPLAAGVTVRPEIQTERTLDGGLLMTATEDRLDPTNPEHLRRARILAETLIARTGYQQGGATRV
jgi:Immunity protein 52